MECAAFGALVRDRRQAEGLTQGDVAELLNDSSYKKTYSSVISQLETGKRMPAAWIVDKLQELFDLPGATPVTLDTIRADVEALKISEDSKRLFRHVIEYVGVAEKVIVKRARIQRGSVVLR